ncbi:uncharacterized protein YigE (DUF2233 family) [Pelomonas saccharophila]|uniref:Uncharacterized protein YigE (DUF2233 family) n=1 Tax=Roseateles saccharophilus TaxID=304 RepID=A0ABU1YU56_ROSSA|nr:phosphodiester glycosidase family protein [Roseateles saccharophilus]MDR7272385.1 uncharacterized protein YigE (DUF2233 family) [Roseateles saccharophilus]
MKRVLLGLGFALIGLNSRAEGDATYTVVRVEAEKLRLYWRDDADKPLRRLDRLAAWLKGQGRTLAFGMNAGMYHADASPVGLLVIDGREIAPLNLASGQGNFFLKPNGVFLVDAQGPRVIDALDYPALREGVRLATQSGPLLLKQGQIHPALGPNSASRYIRNGVCAAGSQALFVITEKPVTLYEFASYFRDALHCQDALYLDGAVSSLYSPRLGRNDHWSELGPLLAIVE